MYCTKTEATIKDNNATMTNDDDDGDDDDDDDAMNIGKRR